MYKKYGTLLVILIVAAAVIGALYFYWRENSIWRAAREEQKRYAAAEAFMSRYDEAMKADTYGGKTPEETLQLFIDALEKGDIDLAAKYFMLETNENDPDYLTRRKWEEGLKIAKETNRLQEVVMTLRLAKPDLEGRAYDADYKFVSDNDQGVQVAYINMELNKYSGVWKIQSL